MATHPASRPLWVIYKITYPDGRIYIGQDRTDDAVYFGSCDLDQIRAAYPLKEGEVFTMTKEILWQRPGMRERDYLRYKAILKDPRASHDARAEASRSLAERAEAKKILDQKERELILKHNAISRGFNLKAYA